MQAGDRECWVYVSEGHEICVSFRGTEVSTAAPHLALLELLHMPQLSRPLNRDSLHCSGPCCSSALLPQKQLAAVSCCTG